MVSSSHRLIVSSYEARIGASRAVLTSCAPSRSQDKGDVARPARPARARKSSAGVCGERDMHMAFGGFCRFAGDFALVPSLLQRSQVQSAFQSVAAPPLSSCGSGEGRRGRGAAVAALTSSPARALTLNFERWQELLCRIALVSFKARDGYNTPERQVSGLLQWMDSSGGKDRLRQDRSSVILQRFRFAAFR